MLVMYTLYQSIASALPQTAYLKMIDVWLLFGLMMPFVVFLFVVIWELKEVKHFLKLAYHSVVFVTMELSNATV